MQFDLGGSLGSRTSLQITHCASSWDREMQLAPSLGKPSEPSTKPRPLPAPQPVLTDRTEAATSFTQAVLTCSGEAFGTPTAFNTQLANRLSPSRTKGDLIRAAPHSPQHSAHRLQHSARSETAPNRELLQLTHKRCPSGLQALFLPFHCHHTREVTAVSG